MELCSFDSFLNLPTKSFAAKMCISGATERALQPYGSTMVFAQLHLETSQAYPMERDFACEMFRALEVCSLFVRES